MESVAAKAIDWINQLSKEQLSVIGPVFEALSQLTMSPVQSNLVLEQSHLAASNQNPAPRESLLTLESHLEDALKENQGETFREKVAACLEFVRSEKAQLSLCENSREPAPALLTTDSTTGLPGRLMFERKVTNAVAEGKEYVAALFVVERLVYVNKRFGRATGDRILLFVAQHLAQELPDSSSLSRWSGPSFALLLNSNDADRKIAMQLRAIASKQLSKNIDAGGRSVMLPISCSCMIETLSAESSPDSLFAKMDDFLSAHVSD